MTKVPLDIFAAIVRVAVLPLELIVFAIMLLPSGVHLFTWHVSVVIPTVGDVQVPGMTGNPFTVIVP